MIAHVKQSGELLSAQGVPGEFWTPNGVRASTEKIAIAHRRWNELGLHGLMLVSGAGNLMRGDTLREHKIASGREDVLGRLFTIANTLVLADALQKRGVPVTTFIADSMFYSDALNRGLEFQQYDPEAVAAAYQAERVALVAGGTGKDGQTTDTAVLEYAALQKQHTPDEAIVALKGTKFDGVYEADPREDPAVRRFSVISAHTMLADYDRFSVVDKQSLHTVIETGASLRVYADGQHDLVTVLNGDKDDIGSLIVADDIKPRLAA